YASVIEQLGRIEKHGWPFVSMKMGCDNHPSMPTRPHANDIYRGMPGQKISTLLIGRTILSDCRAHNAS
ncbi:MAG TPA: hypothetical protein VFM77_20445, partial [Terriglobales bacterium]|nr:hypothetical protein [Terriglobales bacterium]